MKICKNNKCNNIIKEKNKYCSFKCRNEYVNKNLRDYKKNSKGLSKKYREAYVPKQCKNPECKKEISYEKKRNDYCNHSCAASHTNKKRKKIKRSKDAIENIREGAKKYYRKKNKKYFDNPNKCKNCNKPLPYNKRRNIYCNKKCQHEWNSNNLDEYWSYRRKCKFNFSLNDFPDEFNFQLIEEHGWYKPKNRGDNVNGITRDHMYSVKRGFDEGIDPKIISHPANCKLMLHRKNISKGSNCSITLIELLEKIEYWNEKYSIS